MDVTYGIKTDKCVYIFQFFPLKIQPKLYFSTRDIICPYRGTLIPLLKNWGIFRVVVRAQVVHRYKGHIYDSFLLGERRRLKIGTTVTEKSLAH
jgi:hypothetical protein